MQLPASLWWHRQLHTPGAYKKAKRRVKSCGGGWQLGIPSSKLVLSTVPPGATELCSPGHVWTDGAQGLVTTSRKELCNRSQRVARDHPVMIPFYGDTEDPEVGRALWFAQGHIVWITSGTLSSKVYFPPKYFFLNIVAKSLEVLITLNCEPLPDSSCPALGGGPLHSLSSTESQLVLTASWPGGKSLHWHANRIKAQWQQRVCTAHTGAQLECPVQVIREAVPLGPIRLLYQALEM